MSKVTWGMPIVLYLFSAGVAAGAFCFAALTSRRPGAGFAASSRASALLAPPLLFFGLAMLILDLGYKIRFWFTMTAFNVVSPMSMGVWLLILFSLVATLYAIFWIPAELRRRIPLVGQWPVWEQKGVRNTLEYVGVPLALLVAIYTGVLLSTTSIPLWRNTALPALFCFSALDTGFAGGVLLALAFSPGRRMEIIAGPFHWLRESYRLLLPVYLVTAGVYLLLFLIPQGKQDVVLPLITGWRGLVWWLGVIGFGVLVPFVIDLLKAKATPAIIAIVLGAPLVGGFLLRLVLVYTGQEYVIASAYRLATMP
jgi:polysulfide reductase chain C